LHNTVTVVLGEEIDDRGRPQRQFTYRVTQANVGYIDDGCNVLARNSPIASKLVTVNPGDESEVRAPKGMRFLTTREVRTLDGPTSLLSPNQKPNFRSMLLRSAGNPQQVTVQNLRSFVLSQAESDNGPTAVPALDRPEAEVGERSDRFAHDPTWIENWRNIYLGDSETSSLSHQYFTRTTPKQESALSNPRGLTFVEGIAGSGKTSIALGRLKFFANFESGEQREHYGLSNAGVNDFSPTNMVGFVLNHSLKRYLQETASALNIAQLPIRDFQEFRADLSNRFGLTKAFKRNRSEAQPCRTQLAWLLAIDTAIARVAGQRLREIIAGASGTPSAVKNVILRIAGDLESAEVNIDKTNFHLMGLADRIAASVMNAEFRARETVIREKMDRETNRNVRFDLENEMDRIRREEERKALSPLARNLLAGLNVSDLIVLVPQLQEFRVIIHRAFGHRADSIGRELDEAINSFCLALQIEGDNKHRNVTDADIAGLIALYAMIADGFEHSEAPPHLYQIRRNTAVFIDEVQDFTEVEVLLMGMTVTSDYNQITLAGDRQQRLQKGGAENYRSLFPFVPRSQQNQPIFLDFNFRQRPELAALSAGFRSVLQGDRRDIPATTSVPTAYVFDSNPGMASLILQRLLTVDANATVAVITPSELEARRWYDLLVDDLAAYHRPALLSHRDDLTRRNDIHFTEVREAKGLEFDVAIVPDISSFDLESVIGCNQFYVAISRPRHALLMGLNGEAKKGDQMEKLFACGLMKPATLPEFPAT
jgi:hypothetical protein